MIKFERHLGRHIILGVMVQTTLSLYYIKELAQQSHTFKHGSSLKTNFKTFFYIFLCKTLNPSCTPVLGRGLNFDSLEHSSYMSYIYSLSYKYRHFWCSGSYIHILKTFDLFSPFRNYLPFNQGLALYFDNLKSPSHKDDFVDLTYWFERRSQTCKNLCASLPCAQFVFWMFRGKKIGFKVFIVFYYFFIPFKIMVLGEEVKFFHNLCFLPPVDDTH